MKARLAVAALVLASALPAAGEGNGTPSRGRLTMQVVHVVNGLDRYPVNYWQYLPPKRYRRRRRDDPIRGLRDVHAASPGVNRATRALIAKFGIVTLP